jgi:hypothetical protein
MVHGFPNSQRRFLSDRAASRVEHPLRIMHIKAKHCPGCETGHSAADTHRVEARQMAARVIPLPLSPGDGINAGFATPTQAQRTQTPRASHSAEVDKLIAHPRSLK